MILDSILTMIDQEMEWCSKNPPIEEGFVKGLKQARYLIEKVKAKTPHLSDADDLLAEKIATVIADVGEAELNWANCIELFKMANAEKRKAQRELREIKKSLIFKNTTDECVYCGHSKMAHSSHGCRQPLRHGRCECEGFLPRLNIS